MDAAGTIVGVLSLGITVCDGVIQYGHSWKNQDDDVRALIALTGGLKHLLEDLDKRLQPNLAHDPGVLQRVKSAIQDCTGHIDSVAHLSEKYTTGRTSGLKGKAKDVVHKLKFPFEKKTLDELREIMVAFRGNVDTALQVLSMHVLPLINLTDDTNIIPVTSLSPVRKPSKIFVAKIAQCTNECSGIFRTPVRKLHSHLLRNWHKSYQHLKTL